MSLAKISTIATPERVSRVKNIIALYAKAVCMERIKAEFVEPINVAMSEWAAMVDIDFWAVYKDEAAQCQVETDGDSNSESIKYQPGQTAVFNRDEYDAMLYPMVRQEFIDEAREAWDKELVDAETQLAEYEEQLKKRGIPKEERQELKFKAGDKRDKIRSLRNALRTLGQKNLPQDFDDAIDRRLDEAFKASGGRIPARYQEVLLLNLEQWVTKNTTAYEFYPTPPDVVEQMIDLAEMQPGMSVLEPSAGKGNIADAIRRRHPDTSIDVVEQDETLQKILRLKGYRLVGSNFMDFAITGRDDRNRPVFDENAKYDRIIMNPPFDRGTDIVHVMRAYKLLAPGGRLVTITGSRAVTNTQAQDAVTFFLFIKEHGTFEVIPKEVFNRQIERGIDIDVALIVLNKPLEEKEAARGVESVEVGDVVTDVRTVKHYMVDSVKGKTVKLVRVDKAGDTRTETLPLPEQFALVPSGEAEKLIEQAKRTKLPDRPLPSDFVRRIAKIITARPELTVTPKSNHIPDKFLPQLKEHQQDGVNVAVESLDAIGGFLNADGTGAGKTRQILMTAYLYEQKYGKPAMIFTETDSIIQTGFFPEAQRIGFVTPDLVTEKKQRIPKRPKNYSGLYDGPSVDVVRFDRKNWVLRPGINLGTYNDLSFWRGKGEEINRLEDELATKRAEQQKMDREYSDKRIALKIALNNEFPKGRDGKRKPKGYKAALDAGLAKLREDQREELIYEQVIESEDALFDAKKRGMSEFVKDASIVLYDEAHNIKNIGGVGKTNVRRAELAQIITNDAARIFYATATPSDKPGDIFYLQRAGLFESEDQFKRIMDRVGYWWDEPVFNKRGKMVRRGEWKVDQLKQENTKLIADEIAAIYDRLTEDGHMIKREVAVDTTETGNSFPPQMIDVDVPAHVETLMEDIEENLTIHYDDGRVFKNRANILGRQKEELEPHKLPEAIRIAEEHLMQGYSIVFFVETVMEGDEPRDATGMPKPGSAEVLKKHFAEKYGEDSVGVIVGTANAYEKYRRVENMNDFQAGDRRIIIATIGSGGTGVNLDDTIGNAPRCTIFVTAPISAIKAVQAWGRTLRTNTQSRAKVFFLFAAKVPVEQWLKNVIATKLTMLGASVKGSVSILDFATMERIEASGEVAAEQAADQKTDAEKYRRHSLYYKRVVFGWEMPSRAPYYVRQKKDRFSLTARIGAQTLAQINVFADEYAGFIREHGLQRKSDKYDGSYYERVFDDKDTESFDAVWNAMLNLVKLENINFQPSAKQTFNVDDKVKVLIDVAEADTVAGTPGTITKVRVREHEDDDGRKVSVYFYDAKFPKGIAKQLPASAYQYADDSSANFFDADDESRGSEPVKYTSLNDGATRRRKTKPAAPPPRQKRKSRTVRMLRLAPIWKKWLGRKVESQFSAWVYGEEGIGKSTWALLFAPVLAANGPVDYITSERATEKTERHAERLGIRMHKISIARIRTIEELHEHLKQSRSRFIIIDSWTKIKKPRNFDLLDELLEKYPEHSFVFLVHARENGRTYAGRNEDSHDCDIVVKIVPEDDDTSVAIATKNRFHRRNQRFTFKLGR